MTKLTLSLHFVLLCLPLSQMSLGAAQKLRTDPIANKGTSSSKGTYQRQSVIRRLYGPENAHVRRNIREVAERPHRAKTGLLGDPNHRVPYENHPYDKPDDDPKRKLQFDNSLFRPMRIVYYTDALDSMRTAENAAKIDFIESQVLPRSAEFWSQALSVVPVSGNIKISTSELDGREFCGDSEFTRVPDEHVSAGISDADLILYVSGTPSSRFCSGTTLAVAVSCNFDQYDRPTAGAINICLDQIELDTDGTTSAAVVQDNVDILIHETAHVLGHSSNSYPFFWDAETGKSRTARPFVSSSVICVDDVERNIILPSEDTMKFAQSSNGQRYAMIVTPKVRAVARNQFDCQSLLGAKLENQPTGTDTCTGDHWDEHDYYPESLSGVISPTTNVLSHLTLALMEDSGWYVANYTQGRMNPWGLGAGCDFVEEPCITTDENGNPELPDYAQGYFCLEEAARGCSPVLTHKMACSVMDYFYIQPSDLPLDRFQYFPDEPTKGGPRQSDYCPLFGSTYGGLNTEKLSCTDPDNADTLNIYSEVFAQDSQCIPTESGDGRCYRTACVKDEMVLKINVRGDWLTCEFDFQKLDVRVGAGALPQTLVCPRLSTACPDLFCPFTCAGRGTCNYANSVNGTIQPKCECFDSEDTSPGCSDSLVPNGRFFDSSEGLLNNLDEDFFDPLLSVFVDHPDKWATASWAWAAGLVGVFLIMLLCICSAFWPSARKKVVINIDPETTETILFSPRLSHDGQENRSQHSTLTVSPRARRNYSRGSARGTNNSLQGGSRRYDHRNTDDNDYDENGSNSNSADLQSYRHRSPGERSYDERDHNEPGDQQSFDDGSHAMNSYARRPIPSLSFEDDIYEDNQTYSSRRMPASIESTRY